MTSDFAAFTARLRRFIASSAPTPTAGFLADFPPRASPENEASLFRELALALFDLQYRYNSPYRRFCQRRGATPDVVTDWPDIPAIPTATFKEFELTCLSNGERSRVFHSSGTTGHRPSRHFHSEESLALYEASLLPWFARHLLAMTGGDRGFQRHRPRIHCLCLSPEPTEAPQSSLVHMFDAVRGEFGTPDSAFVGRLQSDGAWALDFESALEALHRAAATGTPVVLLGTAFSFVHLVDHLAARAVSVRLPAGSRVMETGGYKGRSRSLPRPELHTLISRRLGVAAAQIVCEYGMSELSSQAYDRVAAAPNLAVGETRLFHFPPWARVQVISPESGGEVEEGETGLIRVFDLANTFSVMAVQTEDLAIRRGAGFELLGRSEQAEPRGCSLMAATVP